MSFQRCHSFLLCTSLVQLGVRKNAEKQNQQTNYIGFMSSKRQKLPILIIWNSEHLLLLLHLLLKYQNYLFIYSLLGVLIEGVDKNTFSANSHVRSIYQYSSMALRFSGQNCNLSSRFLLSINSGQTRLGIDRK